MGSKPAVMREKAKMVHRVKGTKLVVHRVRYNRRLAWIDLNNKVWPAAFVEYVPEGE
jgi:hypothetical protein